MAGIKTVNVPGSMLVGTAVLFAATLVSALYAVGRARGFESDLAETRFQLDRLRKTVAEQAAAVASAARGPVRSEVASATAGELDELRAEIAQVRQELQHALDEPAMALASVPEPASSAGPGTSELAPQARAADETLRRVLATLEDQDQALLKEAVKEVLELQEQEERDARRKRQADDWVKQMTKTLSLSASQSDQVGAVVLDRMRRTEELRAGMNDENRAGVRKQIEEVRQSGEQQILSLLTAEQTAKYKEWQSKRQQAEVRAQGKRNGGGNGGGGAPRR